MIVWVLAWLLTGAAVVALILCIDNPPRTAEAVMAVGWVIAWPLGLLIWLGAKAYWAVKRRRRAVKRRRGGAK